MNEKSGLDKRNELFSELCSKYPSYKPQIIKILISKFNCDLSKIDEYLRQGSFGESPMNSSSDSMLLNSDESGKSRVFSFASLSSANSGSSSPVLMTKNYRPSYELSKISEQKSNLQKLDDAFKRLEKHRDFLNMETLCLAEVIQRRKMEEDFPNIRRVESLDKLVNAKYGMPAKSLSYANDLRQPSEMNRRYAGFHGNYNPQPNNNHMDNNNDDQATFIQQVSVNPNQINPNIFFTPKKRENHLNIFPKNEEKRYSANLEPDSDRLRRASGHQRQRSDPWLLEAPVIWECPQCYVKNKTKKCSFCEYDPDSVDVHR